MSYIDLHTALENPLSVLDLHIKNTSFSWSQLDQFENLEDLLIEDCEFDILPKVIFSIPTLNFLTLKNVKCKKIEYIENNELETIECIQCKFDQFPEIHLLKGLHDFLFEECDFGTDILDINFSLPNLRLFEFKKINQLHNLNIILDGFPVLNNFSVRNTPINHVTIQTNTASPVRFIGLNNLQSSNIKLLDSKHGLEKLEVLELNNNKLQQLPQTISDVYLKRLDVSNNPLTTIQFHNFHIKYLTTLYAKSCHLNKIPDLSEAKDTLQVLDLSKNHIEDVQYLCDFKSLIKLIINSNRLKALPSCFFKDDTNLYHIDCNNNNIPYQQIEELKNCQQKSIHSILKKSDKERIVYVFSKFLDKNEVKYPYRKMTLALLNYPINLKEELKSSFENLHSNNTTILEEIYKKHIAHEYYSKNQIIEELKIIERLFM